MTVSALIPARLNSSRLEKKLIKDLDGIPIIVRTYKNIVSTNRYEKPFNMGFGSNITGMLFELSQSQMDRSIMQDIRSSLHRYEPRAKIMDINVVSNPDAHSLQVRLTFRVLTTGEIIDLETSISRLR